MDNNLSQKLTLATLTKIRNFIISSLDFKKFDLNLKSFLQKYTGTNIQQLSNSQESIYIRKQMKQLNLVQLQNYLKLLPPQKKIIGLSVLREQEFSLILVIVPKGMEFRFHDHPKMIGKTRCLSGKFKITSIDPHFLIHQQQNPNFISKNYSYPKQKIKQEILQPIKNCTTRISPDKFNIHRIQALQDSCFLDLLIPDYPQNCCHSFQIIDENNQKLLLRDIGEPAEDIVDMNILLADQKQPISSYSDSIFDSSSSSNSQKQSFN